MTSHLLQCRCGTLKGLVHDPRSANHGVCYCRDCQAFAHFLGRASEVLDERGGTEIIQILPRNVVFTQGAEVLACMRLTPKGLMRWYAGCCKTPIGNTLATPKISFVGLVHTCLERTADTPGSRAAGDLPGSTVGEKPASEVLDEVFGPIRCWANPNGAKGEPKPEAVGLGRTLRWFFRRVLKARLNGDYRKTPFFDMAIGKPVVVPRILTETEHAEVMATVRAAAT
jgi:hypothetical protein